MDPVIIRPPGIDNGAFVVTPESIWYASVMLLFSASAMTDTGSKSFDCALISTWEMYDDPENGNYVHYTYYDNFLYMTIIAIIVITCIMTLIMHYDNYSYYCNYF